MNAQRTGLNSSLPYVAWVIALVSTVGSLFFSEVMGLPPCVLCWYQRVAVYPLVLVIGAGIVMRDGRLKYYALPLCLAGLVVSVYHNLLYYGVIPEAVSPCAQGVPCTEKQIEWLGFITIPLMGLTSFLGLALCLLLYKPEKESV
ncbi:MAG TPA: disulfide bond formation protein B [Pyrinomonadaceae bacterium]|nr:disulfide bond formation protein B [Pyrinomonadaceae bacterium]